ncbi:MAG: ATP-binding protein [Atopobiaceae bacterium]|nr:ATP-binding protein [Atopobiaceae bacterium]
MDYGIVTTTNACHTQALTICKELAELTPPKDDLLRFDFYPYAENSPFSNLVLINALRQFKLRHPEAQLMVRPKKNNTYLTHIGFYKGIGIDHGNATGEAHGSDTYVPVTEIKTGSPLFYNDLSNVVVKLARTLHYDPALEYMLKYVFQESIRNVHEHADTDAVLVAAQKWPTKSLLEIAIADAGCGVAQSLGKRFHREPLDLLRLACQPGISALSNASRTAAEDAWRNSGYGLYVMKELALRCNGRFMICSDEHAIAYRRVNGSVKEDIYPTNYKGLALCLQFRTDETINFYSEIPDIARHGEELAVESEGAITKASGSSGSLM